MRPPTPRSPNPFIDKPASEGLAAQLDSSTSQLAQEEQNSTSRGRNIVHREDSRKSADGIKLSLKRSTTTFNSDATLTEKKSDGSFKIHDDEKEEKQQAAWGGVGQQIINMIDKPERVCTRNVQLPTVANSLNRNTVDCP